MLSRIYVAVPCVCCACGGQKWVMDPLEPEWEVLMNHHVGIKPWSFSKAPNALSSLLSHLSSPREKYCIIADIIWSDRHMEIKTHSRHCGSTVCSCGGCFLSLAGWPSPSVLWWIIVGRSWQEPQRGPVDHDNWVWVWPKLNALLCSRKRGLPTMEHC